MLCAELDIVGIFRMLRYKFIILGQSFDLQNSNILRGQDSQQHQKLKYLRNFWLKVTSKVLSIWHHSAVRKIQTKRKYQESDPFRSQHCHSSLLPGRIIPSRSQVFYFYSLTSKNAFLSYSDIQMLQSRLKTFYLKLHKQKKPCLTGRK